ncbi:MAG: DinB family protein [Anaerolineaceae bacterium]|nr:DinB family protein [Anaerolineaceae bacterium]
MNKSEIQTLFDYNYWANHSLLQSASILPEGLFQASYKISHGSLRGALVHVLAAEMVWRLRCQEGVSLFALPGENEFATLAILQQRWSEEEQLMRTFLSSLNDQTLSQSIKYNTTKGEPQQNPLWQLLVHVVNHGTQFRSEAAVAETDYGSSPGNLDFIYYLRQKGGS